MVFSRITTDPEKMAGVPCIRDLRMPVATVVAMVAEGMSDEEILDAMRYTGRLTGIFAEPAAATAVAGLRRAVAEGVFWHRAGVVAVVTGNGLKDVQSARSAVTQPFDIAPDGDGLPDILRGQRLIP